jgi:hypothetical protein
MKIRALPFFLRLIPLFFLTYYLWAFVEPFYMTRVFVPAVRGGLWLSEVSTDPMWRGGTTVIGPRELPPEVRDRLGKEAETALYFEHRLFSAFRPPLEPQGIPAEWIIGNLVLLVPLMLATPAPTWLARFRRLGLALLLALLLHVADVVVHIKATYATTIFPGQWNAVSRLGFQFLDSFFQGFDTQLFPFAIWAGIHFRELIATAKPETAPEAVRRPPVPPAEGSRAERRRQRRTTS